MRLAELAKALGLPLLTVRRVLTGEAEQSGIAPEVVARIMVGARAHGFPVPQAAPKTTAEAAPRGAATPAIGLIVTDLSNLFFAKIAAVVEESARAAGFVMLASVSGEDVEREQLLIKDLRQRGVAGLIIAPAGPDFEHLRRLLEEDYPFVLLDRIFEELDCDWAAVENQGVARQLCEGLLERGAKRIAFLGGRLEASTMRERLEGYRAALRRRQVLFDNALVHLGGHTEACGRTGAEKLLQLAEPPDAVFCANNRIFTGYLERTATAPSEPWGRLPCACFDELPFMAHLRRPLLVAAQPERGLGVRATELLLARLVGAPPGAQKMTKPFRHEFLEVAQKAFGF